MKVGSCFAEKKMRLMMMKEATGTVFGDHIAFFAGSAALFAHVAALHHERHAAWRVLSAESFGEHLDHLLYQTFLHLQFRGAVVDDAANLRKAEDATVLVGDVGEPIFAEEGATMVFADGVKRSVVNHHVVVDNTVLSVGKGSDDGLLTWVVAAKHLLEHPQNPVGGGFQSLAVGVVADVFQQLADVLLCLFFCDHG